MNTQTETTRLPIPTSYKFAVEVGRPEAAFLATSLGGYVRAETLDGGKVWDHDERLPVVEVRFKTRKAATTYALRAALRFCGQTSGQTRQPMIYHCC